MGVGPDNEFEPDPYSPGERGRPRRSALASGDPRRLGDLLRRRQHKNIVSFGPGSYVEARIKFAKREGFLNAFWAKPVSERWPPEIDVVELFQEGNRPDEVERAQHHIHYSRSGEPSDETTYEDIQLTSRPGGDLTEAYHTYGLEWREDRVVPYVDGVAVHEWTDETILRALAAGGPFYLMLSLNIDKLGTPDRSESWGEAMLVDWVRLWKHRG